MNDETNSDHLVENIVFDIEEMFGVTEFEMKRKLYDMVQFRVNRYVETLITEMDERSDDDMRDALSNASETVDREIRNTLPAFLDKVKGWEDDEDFDILQEITDYAIYVSSEID